MKTLKKSLCLILALVFVLGLCTFGAGAAFTDDADINYDDAVSVMQGLGILKGYEDGSFQPANNVTRAEAATMITKMILGEAAAAKLPAASAFADVPASNWAAPYINYCATKKIIVGYGDGNFGPNDPVTGLQMVKMLLVACGYGEMGEFGPDNWDVNTFTYGVSLGIFGESDAVYEAAATREECALYVFNTLIYVDLVAYDVDFNDYADKDVTFAEKVFKLGDLEGIVIANQATGKDYTIVEYGKDKDGYPLTMNLNVESGAELIGHKIAFWYNTISKKDADKVSYFNAYLTADVSKAYAVSSFFAPKSLNALASEMGYPKTDFRNVKYFVDGIEDGDYFTKVVKDLHGFDNNAVYSLAKDTKVFNWTGYYATYDFTIAPIDLKLANGSKDSDYSYLGTGNIVLILDDEGELVSAISTSYTYGIVTEIDEDVVTFKMSDSSTAEATKYYEGIAEGDYVIATPYGEDYTLAPTTTKTVQVNQLDNIYGINGIMKEQTQANLATKDEAGNRILFAEIEIGQTIKLFIGQYGMAFDAVLVQDAVYNYVYLTGATSETTSGSWNNVTTYKAQAVDGEGKEISLVIGYNTDTDADIEIGTNAVDPGLYKAVESVKDGKSFVVLKGIPADYSNPDADKEDASIFEVAAASTDNGVYTGLETRLSGTGTRQYLTGATKYIYINGVGDDLVIKEGGSLRGFKPTTGVKAYYVAKDNTKPGNVATIWICGTQEGTAAGSYIFAYSSTSGPNVSKSGVKQFKDVNVPYYTVYIDGVSTSNVYVKQDVDAKLSGFYTYSVDADGVYALTPAEEGEETTLSKGAVYNGKLMDADNLFDDIDLADYAIVDLSSGYQDAKGFSHKIADADTLAEALELGYYVTVNFAYDSEYHVPVAALYVTSCSKTAPAD